MRSNGAHLGRVGSRDEDKDGQNSIHIAGICEAGNARNCAETNAISASERPADPLKKPTQPVLALFGLAIGAPNGKHKEGFAWEETKGIE